MAAKGGDSKQALTITLVLFVLLSIILGIMAFMGYSDQAELERDKRAAEKSLQVANKERNRERFLKAMYKVLAGHAEQDKNNDEKNDLKTIAALRREFGEEYKAELALMKVIYPDLNWAEEQDKPAGNSYVDRITILKKDIDKEKKKEEQLQNNLKQANDELAKANEKAQEALTEFNKKINELNTQLAAVPKDKAEAQNKLAEQVDQLNKQNGELQGQLAKLQDERNRTVGKLEKDLENYRGAIKQAQQRIAKIDLLTHDQPKAKVVSIDRSGQVVYIDLGTLDHVRRQLTFSVFGVSSNGRANPERKGSVEVVEILGPHLSKARVTDLRNPNRDPVLTNDLLFNPAWSPSLKEHIAIAGKIDLTGDGRDSTQDFIRSLERMNIAVDAYLDLTEGKEGTLKGQGMTHNTSYLVEGINPGTPEIEKMKQRANELGVTTVPARRFMALMGYRLPPGTIQPVDYAGYPTPAEAAGKPADAPKLGAKEAAKEEIKKDEPKEEMKKDEPKKEEMKKDDKEMKKDDKEMKKDDKEMKKDDKEKEKEK